MFRLAPAFRRFSTSQALSMSTYAPVLPQLQVSLRATNSTGSSKSRRLRKEGLVPGVLYGVDQDRNVLKTLVTVPQKELMRELRARGKAFENTVYEITMGG
eukprot:CAMPEP_0173181066 /NCGR_PEP_ID=MMETSP1141-20130122/7074_1 /TAXON_ID=483371 /ORGANISM="non described non described, Strain CCMP2298" /LENGTH=100 /DNA_ID=CAMNT_0014104005 /DNA_START=140 /DNA_END=438 /DNA_ORIENTATION=+